MAYKLYSDTPKDVASPLKNKTEKVSWSKIAAIAFCVLSLSFLSGALWWQRGALDMALDRAQRSSQYEVTP